MINQQMATAAALFAPAHPSPEEKQPAGGEEKKQEKKTNLAVVMGSSGHGKSTT